MKKEKQTGVKQWNSTLKSYKPMRKVSRKATRHNLIYQKAKREYMREHPVCEVCLLRSSESLHHKARRGKLLCEVKFFCATCNDCHSWIENHPEAARNGGWLLDKFNP